MNSLQDRVCRLESGTRRRMVPLLLSVGLVGGLLGAAASDTVSRQLMGGSLVIVNEDGRPVITLGSGPEGHGRMFIRNTDGTAMLVLHANAESGDIDVFDDEGHRLAKLGNSPTGDGMLLLSGADGEAIVRAGRWDAATDQGQVWLRADSTTEPSTP